MTDTRLFRQALLADLALEQGGSPAVVAAALAAALQDAQGSVLDHLELAEDRRAKIERTFEELLRAAGGDVRRAAGRRGFDRSVHRGLEPEASQALASADVRFRTPLRTVHPERYVGFTPLAPGGMGLNRRVAFKVIRSDAGGSTTPFEQVAADASA